MSSSASASASTNSTSTSTSTSHPRFGLVVRFAAGAGHESAVSAFLKNAVTLADRETETLTWYALQFSATEFGVFDSFPTDSGRTAHLTGAIASQLPGLVEKGVIGAPSVEKVDIIASKLTKAKANDNAVGLLVRVTPATATHTAAVKNFLKAGQPLAEAEPGTNTWYALEFADGTFGVFDTFPNDDARKAHLNGAIGSQLPGLVKGGIIQPPKVENVQISAVKLP